MTLEQASRLAAALADGIAGKVPQEQRRRHAFSVTRRESAQGRQQPSTCPGMAGRRRFVVVARLTA